MSPSFCVLFSLSLLAASYVQGNDNSSITTTSSPSSTIAPTTSKPQTSTHSKPNVTTESQTTEAPATTTMSPATTVGPTPGKPEQGTWTVHENGTANGTVCLKLKSELQLFFTYPVGKTQAWRGMNVPATATAGGTCFHLTLTFFENWSLDFLFNDTNGNVLLDTVTLRYVMSDERFPDYKGKSENLTVHQSHLGLWSAKDGNSYMCETNTTIDFSNTTTLSTINMQVQAGYFKDSMEFGSVQQCPADANVNYIVPIAVGASLAILVVVILIVYLIGRARNQRGYEAV